MITYIIKTILCSALLISIYYLFLEDEKMHSFKRFFLLFGIVFSFIVPLISIKTRILGLHVSETINFTGSSLQNSFSQQILPPENDNFTFSEIFLIIYSSVTAFLFCRFIINVFAIFFKIRNSSLVQYMDAKLVLTKD